MDKFEEYRYLISKEGVCGGRPTIKGTRIEPSHIANYGKIEEIAKDFSLSKEEVEEAIRYYNEHKKWYKQLNQKD